jgi:molybdopterin converting factor small subunit
MDSEATSDHVTVKLPRVLAELTGCERSIAVKATTLAEALADLVRRYPALGVHLFDEAGDLRRHVRCFRNEVAVDNRSELDQRLSAGDRLTLMSSVAGG